MTGTGFRAISIDEETYNLIKKLADRNFRTMSGQLRLLVQEELKREYGSVDIAEQALEAETAPGRP